MPESKIKTAIYLASVSCLADENLFAAAYRKATGPRREKADKLRMEKDKRLCLGAELLLRYALGKSGAGEEPLEFSYGADGKPFLSDGRAQFSISHSGTYVLCAVGERELGCDIEQIQAVDLQLAKRFFTEGEYASLCEIQNPAGREDAFYRLWTLKESYLKAIGTGIKQSLDSFEIVRGENITLLPAEENKTWHFTEYKNIPGYACALCAKEEIVPLITAELSEILKGEVRI